MDNEYAAGNEKIASHDGAAMQKLTQVPTSVTLSPEQFEKLYLNPLSRRQPEMTKKLGNPTPLGLGGFIITATPFACCLMGWRGAGGEGVAFTGVLTLFGGILLVLASILEFILANTFSCVVFGQLGAFCFALGATMIPSFNAAAPYSTSGNTFDGLHSAGFVNTFAFFFISMAALMFIYMICATRTNAVYVVIFFSLVIFFTLAAAGYWRLGVGDHHGGERLVVGSGATLFVTCMCGWYVFAAQLLDSVGFPIPLPLGDLTHLWDQHKIQQCGGAQESESLQPSDK